MKPSLPPTLHSLEYKGGWMFKAQSCSYCSHKYYLVYRTECYQQKGRFCPRKFLASCCWHLCTYNTHYCPGVRLSAVCTAIQNSCGCQAFLELFRKDIGLFLCSDFVILFTPSPKTFWRAFLWGQSLCITQCTHVTPKLAHPLFTAQPSP